MYSKYSIWLSYMYEVPYHTSVTDSQYCLYGYQVGCSAYKTLFSTLVLVRREHVKEGKRVFYLESLVLNILQTAERF